MSGFGEAFAGSQHYPWRCQQSGTVESEGIQDCDALITMTGMDEQNIIISLYGNNCGVPQVITKVGHLDHTKIIENLPIGSIVSPKELCTNAIVRYVRAMHNQEGARLRCTVSRMVRQKHWNFSWRRTPDTVECH